MQEITSTISVNRFDIEDFVKEATWKDVLTDLVKKNELNPWDIDIIDLVGKYVGAVRGMQVLDLRVPANIILAAAILLRLKSDMLELEERIEEPEGMEAGFTRPYVQVDGLSLRLRLPPKRRVSLNELITALEEAMKLKEFREARVAEETRMVPLILNRSDVEADSEKVYETLKLKADKSRMLTFTSLCDVSNKENNLLDLFIPLLFLANKNRVLLIQENFFEEILIALK